MMFTDPTGRKSYINFGIDIWSLINKSGQVWFSNQYKPKHNYKFDQKNQFKYIANNLLSICESFLSLFEANAIKWSLQAVSITDTGFTLISASIDLFNVRMYASSTEYLGINVGTASANIGIDFGNSGMFGIELKATALTIGAYSQYVDAELLLGSISFTAKIQNGTLKFGFSLGWGFEITIRLW